VIDHVSVGVRDVAAATNFYEAVLGTLGFTRLETRERTVAFGKQYPEFWINLRAHMTPFAEGHGTHIALRARSVDIVDAFHAAALKNGGSSDGAPGLRPHHGEGYYAAFIRDADGNRIEAVTFLEKSA
jgi:catechol 2,3-dioxygenase-like lactoylglutathione lyase family enzyme